MSHYNHSFDRFRGKEVTDGRSIGCTLMKMFSRDLIVAIAVLAWAALCCPGALHAQGSPALQITTIQAAPGTPVQFTFRDTGTGATNYLVEFAPAVGEGGVWSNVTSAVVQSLGGGNFRVQVTDPQTALGFFRVRGYGGAAGFVSASFNSTALQATEGGVVLPTIHFSAPYHGIVRYTISGTAMSGDYVSLSGQVFVNGTTATIPVTLLDNQNIGQLRYLTLTLEGGPGLQLGAGNSTTINILENDADWQGSLMTDNATVGFVLRIQEANGARAASLRSDGFGFFPTNETPASISFTENFFAAVSGGVPVPASATLLNTAMSLTLAISAQNGLTNQSVSPTLIKGVATLTALVPALPHLSTTNFGTFLLVKPPVKPSTNDVQLATAP